MARSRFKQASGEAMRVAGLANKYISESEPWKLGDDPERQATVLHTALQVVDDAKTLLTPFLPHSSQKVFEALGGQGIWAAQPEIREVTDFNDDVEGVGVPGVVDYPVMTGDYAGEQASWRRTDIEIGPTADQAHARCSRSWTRSSARPARPGPRSRPAEPSTMPGRRVHPAAAERPLVPAPGAPAGSGGRRAHPSGRLRLRRER